MGSFTPTNHIAVAAASQKWWPGRLPEFEVCASIRSTTCSKTFLLDRIACWSRSPLFDQNSRARLVFLRAGLGSWVFGSGLGPKTRAYPFWGPRALGFFKLFQSFSIFFCSFENTLHLTSYKITHIEANSMNIGMRNDVPTCFSIKKEHNINFQHSL